MSTLTSLTGTLLGTAVADAIGLPYEGLSSHRAKRLLGEPDRHRLLFGRGMVSDDTEHACMVAQALIRSGTDVTVFRHELARALRTWLLAFPAATGFATLRACIRLWLGISPDRSGVFSAGNGPAMRSPILGAAIEDMELLHEFVRASTRITHSDPRAELGAFAVAAATRLACNGSRVQGSDYIACLRCHFEKFPAAGDLLTLLDKAARSAFQSQSTEKFAVSLGLKSRVTGYMYHTVPVAIQAWLRHQEDFREAVTSVIRCGGDTDSTAAIVGGIVGAHVGKRGIPHQWLRNLCEWPRTIRWMESLSEQLDASRRTGHTAQPPRLSLPAVLLRNALFLSVVLAHGLRRLAPPY